MYIFVQVHVVYIEPFLTHAYRYTSYIHIDICTHLPIIYMYMYTCIFMLPQAK